MPWLTKPWTLPRNKEHNAGFYGNAALLCIDNIFSSFYDNFIDSSRFGASEMTTSTIISNRNPVFTSIARWTARILGLLICLFFLILIVGEIVQAILDAKLSFEPESLFIIIPTAFAVFSYILSWRKEKTGGRLLVAAYFVFSLSPTLLSIIRGEGVHIYLSIFMFSLPFLITGILFLVSSHLSPATKD